MKIDRALQLIKKFEGCRLKAYKPIPEEQWWTIGYGCVGSWVKPDTVITQAQADQLLIKAVTQKQQLMHQLIKTQLSQNEYEAILSFFYNAREDTLRSTLNPPSPPAFLERLNAGDKDGACSRMKLWCKGEGGRVLEGLRRRRTAEILLWRRGVLELDDVKLDGWWDKIDEVIHEPRSLRLIAPDSFIQLTDIIKYWQPDNSSHRQAVGYLQQELENHNTKALQEVASIWRSGAKPQLSAEPATPLFTFNMPLKNTPPDGLVVGILKLHNFGGEPEFECTSGQKSHQYSGGTKAKGKGPIPGHKAVTLPNGKSIDHYWVSTTPSDRRGTKGIEGNAFYITPDPVVISGVRRGEFFIHNDANRGYSPGSSGCPVAMSNEIWQRIEKVMATLRKAGHERVPLEVNH